MSYLDMYQSTLPADNTENDTHESDIESAEAALTPPVQVFTTQPFYVHTSRP